jgi:hypothetical protein
MKQWHYWNGPVLVRTEGESGTLADSAVRVAFVCELDAGWCHVDRPDKGIVLFFPLFFVANWITNTLRMGIFLSMHSQFSSVFFTLQTSGITDSRKHINHSYTLLNLHYLELATAQ